MSTPRQKTSSSRLVYSTETGRICPDCNQPLANCVCKIATKLAIGDGIIRVSLETKGRRGKGVTVIKGVPLDALALAELGKQLKTASGSGGTTKNGIIEIQGDHRDMVMEKLSQRGWQPKRAGG
ncbi:translation initiation factor Sui1 [Alcaligenaceae bacterium]|nr:translation initiation factor Sui1 [Alcaligenaceae bacterium]